MSQVGREGRLTLASDRAAERIAASIVRVVAKGCQASAGISVLGRLTTTCRPKQLIVQRQFVTQARVSLGPKGASHESPGQRPHRYTHLEDWDLAAVLAFSQPVGHKEFTNLVYMRIFFAQTSGTQGLATCVER